jgi:hypothetical protein
MSPTSVSPGGSTHQHSPSRIGKLVLLDPTQCFAGFRLGYLARALPVLIKPTARRAVRFLAWETGGVEIDRTWLELCQLAAEFPAARPLLAQRPALKTGLRLLAGSLLAGSAEWLD